MHLHLNFELNKYFTSKLNLNNHTLISNNNLIRLNDII